MTNLVGLIPLFPLAGALVNGIGTFRGGWSKKAASVTALLGSGAAMVLGWIVVWPWLAGSAPATSVEVRYWDWILGGNWFTQAGEAATFTIGVNFLIDPLSALMVSFVTFIGFLIHVYSTAYMHEEPRGAFARYFAYLNLFMFAMLTLILGGNFLMMFVGWEGVGLCSYLLIGFYYDRNYAADAGKKAFVTNRIGDFGFVLGMLLIWTTFGSLDYSAVFPRAAADPHILARMVHFGFWSGGAFLTVTLATAIGLFLFVGACGKSAQLPLYVWLPDAMAGPTPVSALIHAATMVTAGVYMVTRCNVIFRISSLLYESAGHGIFHRVFHDASFTVAAVGALTAFFAATIGLAQTDIKKVLAYSTVSQLGYMFLGCGVGAYVWGMFHVFTHAFFKACLFLGSGSVIHGMSGEQDITKMGGLAKKMPATYKTMLLATIAIAGFPIASGFYSKDPILGAAFFEHRYLLFGIGLVTAGMTAFYMYRMMYMTFSGTFRGTHEQEHHVHESPAAMTVPLWILAVGAVLAGPVLGFPHVISHVTPWIERLLDPVVLEIHGHAHEPHEAPLTLELILMGLSVAVAVLGWFVARLWYRNSDLKAPNLVAARFPRLYELCFAKWKIDELYEATVIGPTKKLGSFLWDFDARVVDGAVNGSRHGTIGLAIVSGAADRTIVDGLVNGVASVLQAWQRRLSALHTGGIQRSAFILGFGLFGLVAVFLFL